MEKQGELEKLEGELEKQGEEEGRNKGSLGSGLDGTKPQELPARDVGRENGIGDSNLEERDKSEFKIDKHLAAICLTEPLLLGIVSVSAS